MVLGRAGEAALKSGGPRDRDSERTCTQVGLERTRVHRAGISIFRNDGHEGDVWVADYEG